MRQIYRSLLILTLLAMALPIPLMQALADTNGWTFDTNIDGWVLETEVGTGDISWTDAVGHDALGSIRAHTRKSSENPSVVMNVRHYMTGVTVHTGDTFGAWMYKTTGNWCTAPMLYIHYGDGTSQSTSYPTNYSGWVYREVVVASNHNGKSVSSVRIRIDSGSGCAGTQDMYWYIDDVQITYTAPTPTPTLTPTPTQLPPPPPGWTGELKYYSHHIWAGAETDQGPAITGIWTQEGGSSAGSRSYQFVCEQTDLACFGNKKIYYHINAYIKETGHWAAVPVTTRIFVSKPGPGSELVLHDYHEQVIQPGEAITVTLSGIIPENPYNTAGQRAVEIGITPLETVGVYTGYIVVYQYVLSTYPLSPSHGYDGIIKDPGMEQQPVSSHWFTEYDPSEGAKFGRASDSNLAVKLTIGDSRCGQGIQLIGGNVSHTRMVCMAYGLNLLYPVSQSCFGKIQQDFLWPGGKLFYRYSVKGYNYETGAPGAYDIIISGGPEYKQYWLKSNALSYDKEWDDVSGSYPTDIPAGKYTVHIRKSEGQPSAVLLAFDDIVFDVVPPEESCSQRAPAITLTPTPNATPTPGGPAENLISNCGFEMASYLWGYRYPDAEIIYDLDNTYMHIYATAEQPGAWKNIVWDGGSMYVQYDFLTNHRVEVKNMQTGQKYLVNSGIHMWPGQWGRDKGVLHGLPAGTYQIQLYVHNDLYAAYDNVTISKNNYAECDVGGTGGTARWTATPPPVATPNHTPTMYPSVTPRATHTMSPPQLTAGAATYTPWPTTTAIPTYTPLATLKPTYTPSPSATSTMRPTWTPAPTYTTFPTYTPKPTYTMSPPEKTANAPTYTPWPTYTPFPEGPWAPGLPTQPPPTQPPPGYWSECIRPQSGYDVAAWIEYEKCEMLSYFSLNPDRAASTVAAIPTMFSGQEPFGTIGEVSDSVRSVQSLVESYDWSNKIDGMSDQPNPGTFTNPASSDSPWNGGPIVLNPDTAPYSQVCEFELGKVVGSLLSGPMCFIFNILRTLALLPWFQLFINLSCVSGLAFYIWRQWINRGMGG